MFLHENGYTVIKSLSDMDGCLLFRPSVIVEPDHRFRRMAAVQPFPACDRCRDYLPDLHFLIVIKEICGKGAYSWRLASWKRTTCTLNKLFRQAEDSSPQAN